MDFNKTPKSTLHKFNQQVPDPTLPKIFEIRGHSWINYGVDNLYPNALITPLYNGSAMNRTCITSKHIYTVGEGLRTKDLKALGL